MASYTINTWLDGTKIKVSPEEVDATPGTDTITWIATPSDASWKFLGVTFAGIDAGSSIAIDTVQDHTLVITDFDNATSVDTISYTLYVEDNGTTYDSDPFIVNQPTGG